MTSEDVSYGFMPTRERGTPVWLRVVVAAVSVAALIAVELAIRLWWTPAAGTEQSPATWYHAWVLAPAIFTIVLAITLRQVIPALSLGVLLAACILVPFPPAGAACADGLLGGVQLSLEHYLVGAIKDPDHVKVLVFSLTISGMVGVIAANGGTGAVVSVVARWGSTPRRGQIATWVAGLVVFFDDYANAMIVGPAMRPVCDRLRISRAKLAYIVDSTAAPVSSIAIIGTWVGAEVGYIDSGLEQLATRPAFMGDISAYQAFIYSIPYRFYVILALVMVFLIGMLGRDFGPMLKAERDVLNAAEASDGAGKAAGPRGAAWYAVVPVLVLVGVTLFLLFQGGWSAVDWADFAPPPGSSYWFGALQAIMSNADAYNPILYAAVASLVVAIVISLGTGALSFRASVESALDSMSRLLPTMMVLILAWTLSAAMRDLELGEVAVALLRGIGFESPAVLKSLPLCVFVSACVVAFATGTSWGTMGILCPAVVVISGGLLGELPAEEARPVFYAAVGAVLSGAVFGDHCSPISDTTILSSMASSCTLEKHVWTQMPYALVVAVVSVICGDALCRYGDFPPIVGLAVGTVVLVAIVRGVGRSVAGGRPKPEPVTKQGA